MVKIKNIRLGLGLTVADLSQKLGISPSYLTLVENGERRLSKQLVGKLAKSLHLTKSTVSDWYLEQELTAAGITDKKSHKLITTVLKMNSREKESLLQVLKTRRLG